MASRDSWPWRLFDGFFSKIQEPTGLAIIATIVILIISTRALSGDSPTGTSGRRAPSTPPYWVPFFGHAPQLAVSPSGLLIAFRQRYPEGVFSLKLSGRAHSFVYRPSFASQLLDKPDVAGEAALISAFGLSAKDRPVYEKLLKEGSCHVDHHLTGSNLDKLMAATVSQIKGHIADWVSFNSYADQMDWERVADAEVVETKQGKQAMDINLFELTRNFIARTANAALFGTDFVENFPDAWQALWRLDKEFHVLQSSLPAWSPLPQLQRTLATRRKLLSYMREFEQAMDTFLSGEDPGVKWQDLDNVSDVVKDRIALFRTHKLSIDSRAASDLELAWATNTNTNALVAWLVFEISRDVVVHEQVCEEIAPFIKLSQPQNDFPTGVWIAPDIEKLDVDGLLTKSPLLRAAYIETLRLYTGSSTTRLLEEDMVLQENGKGDEAFTLKKGSYVQIPQELHQTDPRYFPEPMDWQADRHIKETVDRMGRKTRTADMGTIRPFGSGPGMCHGQEFAEREVLLYTAIILSLYEMNAPEDTGWEVPATVQPAATKHPRTPLRVFVTRRELPKGKVE